MAAEVETLPSAYTDQLSGVLESFETSLFIGLIATWDVITCSPDDRATEVLDLDDWTPYDQFPVKRDGKIIGVLERQKDIDSSHRVKDVMRSLDERMLLESSTGILTYIQLAAQWPYHLVVSGNSIAGIITRSDLLKLPVRVVLFSFLTHLETTMTKAIRTLHADDSWLEHLSKSRRDRLEDEFAKAEDKNIYSDKLSFTQWCDKRDILAKSLPRELIGSKQKFKDDMRDLEKLRNNIMHSNNYLTEAKWLAHMVKLARHWIGTVRSTHLEDEL